MKPVVIQIPREAVENGYVDGLIQILNGFVPALIDRNRNRLQFEILGYNSDKRELYEIPEVRAWFRKLWDEYTGIFFWLDFRSYMFQLFGLMLCKPVRGNGGSSISTGELQALLYDGFAGLNIFCERHGIDPNPTNILVFSVLKETNG